MGVEREREKAAAPSAPGQLAVAVAARSPRCDAVGAPLACLGQASDKEELGGDRPGPDVRNGFQVSFPAGSGEK